MQFEGVGTLEEGLPHMARGRGSCGKNVLSAEFTAFFFFFTDKVKVIKLRIIGVNRQRVVQRLQSLPWQKHHTYKGRDASVIYHSALSL